MRIIYQKAEEVSIWLGVHDEKSLLAWDLIQDIEECHGNMEAVTKLIEPSREKQFAALLALFRRDYFWRIWVVSDKGAFHRYSPLIRCHLMHFGSSCILPKAELHCSFSPGTFSKQQ